MVLLPGQLEEEFRFPRRVGPPHAVGSLCSQTCDKGSFNVGSQTFNKGSFNVGSQTCNKGSLNVGSQTCKKGSFNVGFHHG